jgi:hypothetical protein
MSFLVCPLLSRYHNRQTSSPVLAFVYLHDYGNVRFEKLDLNPAFPLHIHCGALFILSVVENSGGMWYGIKAPDSVVLP